MTGTSSPIYALTTPAEGGRRRAVQGGYHAQWWLVGDGETWLGGGPIDLLDERRSIRPGEIGRVPIRPMDPSAWRAVGPKDLLHLRERVGQTLGIATVRDRVAVPDTAPLRLDAVPLRPGEVFLERRESRLRRVLDLVRRKDEQR